MRPVRVIVGYPPGGPTDIAARLIGQWLSDRLGQSFVVENRPGAAGNTATEMAVRAPADGYTLLMINATHTMNTALYDTLNFDFIRDIAPIAAVYQQPLVLEVNPSIPVKTVAQLIAFAKANPGKLNLASAGIGTPQHVAGEMFKMMTDVNMLHVPYRGAAPALTDLLGGQVQVMFDTLNSSIGYIRAGKLRALGVTTPVRSEAIPGIPTVNDFVPGFDVRSWQGIGAPSNTPAAVIDKLNKEINFALADAQFQIRLADLGCTPFSVSPKQFGEFIAADTEKWTQVIKFAAIRL